MAKTHQRSASPGRRSLPRDLPVRALVFLRGIARTPEIREALGAGGFRQRDHDEGFTLLRECGRYLEVPSNHAGQSAARASLRELHAWASRHFPRYRAALARLRPGDASLFPVLTEPSSLDSVLAIAKLLAHLDESEPELTSLLALRGLDATERARLSALVCLAQSAHESPPSHDETISVDQDDAAQTALLEWYRDWSETARRLITRKDYLIALGLRRRGAE